MSTLHSNSLKRHADPIIENAWEHLKTDSLFVTCIYVRYWFQTPSPTTYLSELLVGLSFFDNDMLVEKRLMVLALRDKEGSEEPSKCIPLFSQPCTKGLHDFVTTRTLRLFRILRAVGCLPGRRSERVDNQRGLRKEPGNLQVYESGECSHSENC